MINFDKGIWNRLYHGGEYIATELQPTINGYRRWVAIYKVKSTNPLAPKEVNLPKYKYLVLDFELKETLVDEYFSDEDKHNERRFYVNTEDELVTLLERLMISPASFTYPWKCDYPL